MGTTRTLTERSQRALQKWEPQSWCGEQRPLNSGWNPRPCGALSSLLRRRGIWFVLE